VDESSQIGVRAMHNLLTEAERAGTCILFLGDRAQTLAVSAGSGIALVARTVEAAEISKVVRQSDPQLRLVVEQLARVMSSPRWKRWPTATASSRQTVRLRPSK
jgi:hypothetical protein